MPIWQVQQHGIPRGAFNQCADSCFITCPQDEIAFPVAWYSTVINFGRPISNHHHVIDEPFAWLALPSCDTMGSALAQCLCNFFAKTASGLEVEHLIDRFMAHMHSVIVWILQTQFTSDLFRRIALGQTLVNRFCKLRIGINFALFRTQSLRHTFSVSIMRAI
ncbi:hypothetical protein CAQU_06085 [Corynebacterium aquilae DSM 44791]|uniref:Uncharacterized protein n=1 Tax=Corynebacterium aquilae DSM 44791 TaxID=1431546 RepID=A0A1L7CFU0_9CORY|nr:hypothetical protein CAQU_06085 [Corynebacterium aquilae DSM 44791]